MAIKANKATRSAISRVKQSIVSNSPNSNAFSGMLDASNVAGNTAGLNPRKVQGVMQSIDNAIIKGDNDSLKAAVRRSGGYQDTLQGIDPIPTVRYSSAKAFADNT